MRIALTSAHAWPEVRRGGERYLHELAANLQRAGHRVFIVAGGTRYGVQRQLEVPVWLLHRRPILRRKYGMFGEEFGFAVQSGAFLAGRRLDVWHAMTTADAAVATSIARIRRGVRTVFTDLGTPTATTRGTPTATPPGARRDAALYRTVVDRVSTYVCLSEFAGSLLRRDQGREPTVITPGVEMRRYTPAGSRHPRPAILFASDADVPWKGAALLLDAVAELAHEIPGLELWLAGPGDPSNLIRQAPAAARRAVTMAHLADEDELRDRYAKAWVTALPSRNEAFGMVAVESLASGTPVAALTCGGGVLEIINESVGRVGPPTAEGLAAALRQAIDLGADRRAATMCRERASAFDWSKVIVPQFEAIYSG